MSEFQETTHPKARKPHRCNYCNVTIQPGETYIRTKWFEGGTVLSVAVCDECAALSEDLYALGYEDETEDGRECYPYLPGVYFWDEVRERSPEWSERVDAYLARLTAGVQR